MLNIRPFVRVSGIQQSLVHEHRVQDAEETALFIKLTIT